MFRCSSDSQWDSLLSMQSVVRELDKQYDMKVREIQEQRKKRQRAAGGSGGARREGNEEEEEEEELLLVPHFGGLNGEGELRRKMDI
jgi:hypothetical protein